MNVTLVFRSDVGGLRVEHGPLTFEVNQPRLAPVGVRMNASDKYGLCVELEFPFYAEWNDGVLLSDAVLLVEELSDRLALTTDVAPAPAVLLSDNLVALR